MHCSLCCSGGGGGGSGCSGGDVCIKLFYNLNLYYILLLQECTFQVSRTSCLMQTKPGGKGVGDLGHKLDACKPH